MDRPIHRTGLELRKPNLVSRTQPKVAIRGVCNLLEGTSSVLHLPIAAAIHKNCSTSVISTDYFRRDGNVRVRGGPGQEKKQAGGCEAFRNTKI